MLETSWFWLKKKTLLFYCYFMLLQVLSSLYNMQL